ncbi:hypothetical protein [Deinococcus peraridilitoris]|uniref:Uncharacterized protein n=1 Tax=Deinococcus peraridilitoris (strain DSM 19664 / LMG 22246 / CIP 109416 / KR-200) TaxID=937777 RepID=L0A6U8_DEIPD|nr:hypothetical protein [Deinococcus peraridilitoris]AFZ68917.1 hypothetical protein Deipe_3484 [Deinococcus peraridilitoris DSM 19664]
MTEDTGMMATGGLRGISEDTPEHQDRSLDGISGARDAAPSTERYSNLQQGASVSAEPDQASLEQRAREEATVEGLVSGPRGGVTGTSDS